MSDRKIINKLPDILKSDIGLEYPVDIVKDAYLKSEAGLNGFCRRYGLSKAQVKRLIDLDDWDSLREQYRQKMFNIMAKQREELVEWKQDLVQRAEFFKLMEIESQLNDLQEHIAKYGDVFVRNSEGEIVRDGYGNPSVRKIPMNENTVKLLHAMEVVREKNLETMKTLAEDKRKNALEDGKTIDIDDFFDKED